VGSVYFLDGSQAHPADVVGGKAAGLAAFARHDLPVPPAFAVGADAYRRFVADARIDGAIDALLCGVETPSEQAQASARIRDLFEAREPRGLLLEELADAYGTLGGGEEILVAVRSSAIGEDTAHESFAGCHDSYLAVKGIDAIARAVVRCWASLFTPQALALLRERDLRPSERAMGVVVQAMVPAEAAGVMFTIDPVTGDPSQIAIEGSAGLGTAVVGGEVTPDRFYVDKVTLEIRARALVHQERPAITDTEVIDLATIGKRVDRALGAPQDIEWAIAAQGREIFLLQARPETVWSRKAGATLS
jgi:phosphoenolpyruvate synthase/pyruvate phosphate dikinase